MRKASPLPLPAYPTPQPPWAVSSPTSSPVNTAATGKTSQVIERLTAENDRLRREIKAERAAKEDAQQQLRTVKAVVEQLKEKNNTLQYQFETNDNALARKERRLDDLKSTLEREVDRRRRAEDREAEMGRELGETTAEAAKQVSEAQSSAKFSDTAYSTLSKEYRDMDTRVHTIHQEMRKRTERDEIEREEYGSKVAQLEILLDQQRQQQEKSDEMIQKMADELKGYRETDDNVKVLEVEMDRAVKEMRWVMRLQTARGPS